MTPTSAQVFGCRGFLPLGEVALSRLKVEHKLKSGHSARHTAGQIASALYAQSIARGPELLFSLVPLGVCLDRVTMGLKGVAVALSRCLPPLFAPRSVV
mmetsp:Transcript_9578/g.29152  ORF Transcript_9578/g.29152 Transcript_9578/m.29152 type:complete len:99 (+) Transcript_9578:2103-2399(+)|eukprot:scaffold167361_cov30-Tisochrysis_lutea.AAC.2